MAIPVEAAFAVTSAANNTTITVAAVSGVISGDVVVLIVLTKSANVDSDEFNTPTGWAKIVGLIPSSSAIDCMGMSYIRAASGDSGDDNPIVTWSTSAPSFGWYIRVTGADTSDMLNIAGVDAQTVSTSIACPSVTTDKVNCLAFYFNAFDGGDGLPMSVSGAGWTESAEKSVLDSDSTNVVSGSFGTKDQASAAATGDATVTADVSDGIIGAQFAINEAAAGGANPKGPLGMVLTGALGGPI